MLRTNRKSLGNHEVSPEEEKEMLQWRCMLPFIVFWAVTLGYTVRSIDPRGVADGVLKDRLVCILRIFLGGGNSPSPQKPYQSPLTAAKLCAVNFFSAAAMNCKYIAETFF